MNRPTILDSQTSYTFSKYFELSYEPEDIFAEFDCSFERRALTLPQFDQPVAFADELRHRLERAVDLTNIASEMARRELLIAPVVFAVCDYLDQEMKIEYQVDVSRRLKGTFDYFIPSPQNLLVIEAKNADLGRGFNQLGAELIALDQWTRQETPILYGAVTTGDSWQFGQFIRAERKILKDTKLYSTLIELEKLLSVLIGIIQPAQVPLQSNG
ncbi:hypothetical protein [Leptolyngbya sp. BC1307]|uniref:hypothetical protein n=1 Tax=Leptolyngbya sp. BC1307 TaxID=2029589 RepID=UPI000EFBA501|nr:hypothetical protein [Leptolyngbya sp. BC1307]